MNKVNWIIEENDNYSQKLIYTLLEKNCLVATFKYIPFEGTDYSFLSELNNPCVLMGSINVVEDIYKRVNNPPRPLVWCNWNRFLCSTYYIKLNDFIFQNDYQFIKFKDIQYINCNNKLFLRPDDSRKSFCGQVVDKHLLKEWSKYYIEYKGIDQEIDCVYSSVKDIDCEWRLVIINNQVITGSQYKQCNCIDIQPGYPIDCKNFAEKVSQIWSPEPIYVMDVALRNNNYYVMEVGPLNVAGLYMCEYSKIVDAIESYINEMYSL